MFTRRSMLVAPFLAAALAPLSVEATADDYPSGPVTLIVSFPPGGSLDVVARAMAPKLQERLGKPLLIENRTRASGARAGAAGPAGKPGPEGGGRTRQPPARRRRRTD